jgi:type III restriction enzyme
MASDSITFRNDDLVLNVRQDFDPELLHLDQYEAFIDALCGDREYQKDAIRTVCRFLAGGQYKSTSDLAEENYAANARLGDRYGSLGGLIESLPFPDKLACSVDLATGTGKSWVMYGVARILLAEGVVDRVLVLCPSLTIESGLTAKFKRFSADRRLRDLVPDSAGERNPEITTADVTTGPGDICIENIHATFEHVRSSVRDSFAGQGGNTLVLNDETHHVYSPPVGQQAIRKWKAFIDDDAFSFTRIAGFSGTCYVKNDYFSDVVFRYSLNSALADGVVKDVRYVAKDESVDQAERFQKYLQRHRENETRYPNRKPLSVLVTARQNAAQALADEFVSFLAKETKLSKSEAAKRVLVVTSASEHKANVAKLPYVDRDDSPVEWIFSVSMLTEGWDVQNVFQIVPHEKRAFNSKLLIAQVLGRGLRVPQGLTKPAVWVFNHSSWSSEIQGLVQEVLEQERRLHSYPVTEGDHAQRHFELPHLKYTTKTSEQELKLKNGNGQVQLFKKGFVKFESQPEELERQTVFASALDGRESVQRTTVHYAAYSVEEVVKKLHNRLKSVDAEGDTKYAKDYPPKALRKVVKDSLKAIDEKRDLVSEQNLQHAYRAMGNIKREVAKAVRIELEPDQLFSVNTREMRTRSVALSSFFKEATVCWDSESLASSEDVDQRALAELTDDDSPYPRRAVIEVDNKYRFKTPVNVVLTTHEPERRFVKRLFEPAVADSLDGWVKAPDVSFYEIQYSWRKGDHTKQGKFNPDFFLSVTGTSDVVVVELKGDADVSDENRAKLRFANDHFARVNELQSKVNYSMKFLSPKSYDGFFQSLTEGTAPGFISALEAKLLAD